MTNKIWTTVLAVLLIAAMMTSMVACGGKNSENNQSVTSQPYYVDEETGDIIDSATGEKTDNENLVVDKETGDIIDKTTNETVVSRPATSSKPSSSTSSKPSSNTKPNTNTSSKLSGNAGGGTVGGNTDNNIFDNIVLPTSSKKVSFNHQNLVDVMSSIYEYPKLMPIGIPISYEEYCNKLLNEKTPSNLRYITEWYLDYVNNNGPETLLLPNNKKGDMDKLSKALLGDKPFNDSSNSFNILAFEKNDNCPDGFFCLYCPFGRKATIENFQHYFNLYNDFVTMNNETHKEINDANIAYYNKQIDELKKLIVTIENAVKKAGVKSGENEVLAINKIIDYICDICTYSYTALEDDNSLGGHQIQDVLEINEAVCDGYAKTFWAMCKYCDIDVEFHSGKTADGKRHAWNSIKINGKDYYFDTTWHDNQLDADILVSQEIWCEKSEFDKDHIRESSNIKYW